MKKRNIIRGFLVLVMVVMTGFFINLEITKADEKNTENYHLIPWDDGQSGTYWMDGYLYWIDMKKKKISRYSDEEMTKALYVASGIGGVIASRAFIAGAQGGCQAEIGSASAMAAGGAVHLRGGSVEAVAHAAAMALKNLLGLVCDPVAGLVEVPCVKRNVSGAVVALSAADMALAGVRSRIPPDEVIDAMREVGISMPACLRETGEGGLAATPEGIKMRDRIMD